MLSGPEGDPLDVAMPGGVDRRVGRGVVSRDGAVRADPQDLAVERGVVGGVLRLERVAGADPQVAVRADHDASAVVAVGGLDAVEQHAVLPQRSEIVGDAQGDDGVFLRPGHIGVDRAIGGEVA
ncbi:hypothetical protein OHA25_15720 [Nonomuraea sp. NBC_00507]